MHLDEGGEWLTLMFVHGHKGDSSEALKFTSSASSPSSTPTHDDSMRLDLFFAPENQGCIASIANSNNVPVAEVRRMAEYIPTFWALTDKTHSSYSNAASHLIFSITDQATRERHQTKMAIRACGSPRVSRGAGSIWQK